MKNNLMIVFSVFLTLNIIGINNILGQQKTYPQPDEINAAMKKLQQSHSDKVKILKIAQTPGKNEVLLFEIGSEINSANKTKPAIFVVGNLMGIRPLSSLASLYLAEQIITDSEKTNRFTWYIIPNGNPDAAWSFFREPLSENTRNAFAWNDDMDDLTDEDGYNDLNQDGYITCMRVKHPEGKWIPVEGEPRLMRKADSKKGEQGIYKLYTEGIDDDGDGKYNEDIPGGTNVNKNFPHLFKHFTADGGQYPGSAEEAEAIMKFVFDHPEIAMAFSFGSTNFCMTPPKGGRKGEVDLTAIKIPKRYAEMFNADPEKSYSMKEIIEMVQSMVPAGMKVDESMVAGFLGLGAVVNPLAEDLVFYGKFSKDYKDFLKGKGIENNRFDPEPAPDGSFVLWSYYHLGIPVFSMDLWGIEKPANKKDKGEGLSIEKLEKMSSDDFIALGEEKISKFLKDSGAPDRFSAKGVMKMVKEGQTNPAQMASMMKNMKKPEKDNGGANPKEVALLKYSDEQLGGKGFVEWEEYNHPTLGKVEIGGFVPFTGTTPVFETVDSILEVQIPWVFHLVDELPALKIKESKLVPQGGDIYRLDLWIENTSMISYPTAMGKRNKQPAPSVLLLDGKDLTILSGKSRTPVEEVKRNSAVKNSWLLKAKKGTVLKIELKTPSAGTDVETIKIGG